MKDLIDMSEAHLQNVKQEIERLHNQSEKISSEIQRLTDYLEKGAKVLDSHRAELQQNASPVENTP